MLWSDASLYCFVCCVVGLFLLLNNLSYISLGSVLGVYTKRVPMGMIASTIFSQISLVAAGFFNKLPPALDWIRYISPFYWSFRGILKSCFKWSDTLECFKGSSDVGANQCYLEFHPAIDQYKSRGINVATYNDSSSNTVYVEYLALVFLLLFMNSLIFLKAWFVNKSFQGQSDSLVTYSRSRIPFTRHALYRSTSVSNQKEGALDNKESLTQMVRNDLTQTVRSDLTQTVRSDLPKTVRSELDNTFHNEMMRQGNSFG